MGWLGQLAGGYVDAARQDRARQDALDERQREMQMGLGSMILQNPAVPPEYKGPVMEHLVQVVNTPRGKKLPSWDKMMTSLPATYGPSQTSTVQQPPVTLSPPQAPPGVGGVAGLPDGVTPQGPSQNLNLPATQTHVVGRPQTSMPGQFHVRSEAEMAQEQVASQMAAQQQFIDSLKSQGFSDEQIALKLGMSKMMPIPFGGLYNIGTGETVSPTNIPRTKVQYMVGGQGPYFGFVSKAGGPIMDVSGNEVPGAVPFNQAMNMPVRAFARDGQGIYSVLLDKKTNQPIPGSINRDIMPPPGYLPKITESEYHWTDEDGNVHSTPTTSVSRPSISGPSAPPGVQPKAGSKPAASSGAAKPATPGVGGDRIISGNTPKETAATRGIQNDAIKASQTARTMVNLLDTQKDYMDGIESGKMQPTPRQDLSLIIAAVRAMNPGTVRLPNKELELELKAGSYGDRFRRAWDIATQGTLPDDQRKDLFSVVNNETSKVAQDAAKNWSQAFEGKRPVPPHLQRFAVSSPNTPPSGGQKFSVTTPDGQNHVFDTQAQLDEFNRLVAEAQKAQKK